MFYINETANVNNAEKYTVKRSSLCIETGDDI